MNMLVTPEAPLKDVLLACVYRRFNFHPKRDRRSPVNARTVFSVASYLLKEEMNLSHAEIAAAIEYEEHDVPKFVEHGTKIVGTSSDLQQLVFGIRSDIYEHQKVRTLAPLPEKKPEPPQKIELPVDADIPAITKAVAVILGVSPDRLYGEERIQIVADARNIVFAITKRMNPQLSYRTIGYSFGNRDQSTVRSGIFRVSFAALLPTAKNSRFLYQKIKLVCDMLSMDPAELIIRDNS